jgi:hypothetical protein
MPKLHKMTQDTLGLLGTKQQMWCVLHSGQELKPASFLPVGLLPLYKKGSAWLIHLFVIPTK